MKVLIRKSQRPPVDVLIQYSQKLPTVKQVAKDRVKTDPDLAPYQGVLLNDFGIDADDLTGKYQFWDWVANAPKPELLNMARGVDATDSTERLKGNHRFVRPDDKEIPAIKSEVGESAEPYNAFYVRDGINGGYDSVWGVPGENPTWTDNYQAYKLKSRTVGAKDRQPRKRRARRVFLGASGLRGTSEPLQHIYENFDEFKNYSETYGLHKRLGFRSAKAAWDANPRVGHTVEPSDYAIVKSDTDDYTPNTAKSAGELVEKREFDTERRETLADEGKALPDGSFPIVNGKDLANAVKAIGRAKNPEKAKAHIKARARALGLTDQLPEEWKTEKSESMPDGSFTILSAKDLEDALALINRAADPATVKAHIIRRSIALDLIDKLPDGWVKKSRTVGAKDKQPRKRRYSIEPKINEYAGSADYGKPYGINLIDNAKNEKVTSVLLHDWKNLYAYKLDKDTQKELEDYATKHLSDETPEELLDRVQDAHEEAAQAQEALNKMGASTPYDAMSRERREAYDRTAKWAGELWQRHDALKQRYTSMKKSVETNPLKSVKVIGPQGQQGTLDDVVKGAVRLVSRRSPLAKSNTSEEGE